MSLPDLLIGALAVWRVSALLAYERGPFAIFTRMRRLVGIEHFDDGTPDTDKLPNELAKLIACVWCSSPWIAVLWLVGMVVLRDATMIASSILALSAASIMADRLAHG